MTRYLLFTLGIALISCNSEKNAEDQKLAVMDFSYKVDTVIIDAGDDFPFLNTDLFFSDYSPKEGLLYNLNNESGRVEIINLKNNTMARLIQYDFDGPNNIKEMALTGLKKATNGDLFFMNYLMMNQLDSSDSKIASYRLSNDFLKGDDLAENEVIDGMGSIASDGSYFLSIYFVDQLGGPYKGVAKITFADSTLQLIPFDFWAGMDKYDIRMDAGNGRSFSASESKFLTLDGANFILSTTAKNELWYYDSVLDSVVLKQYSSAFTQNEKVADYPKTANNQESFDQANKRMIKWYLGDW
jgi:hypothetical protein